MTVKQGSSFWERFEEKVGSATEPYQETYTETFTRAHEEQDQDAASKGYEAIPVDMGKTFTETREQADQLMSCQGDRAIPAGVLTQ